MATPTKKIVSTICRHLINSGFDCHPPWHTFGPSNSGSEGAARIYTGNAHTWLGKAVSEHLTDILFQQRFLSMVPGLPTDRCNNKTEYYHTPLGAITAGYLQRSKWRPRGIPNKFRFVYYGVQVGSDGGTACTRIYYGDPELFAKIYGVIIDQVERRHESQNVS